MSETFLPGDRVKILKGAGPYELHDAIIKSQNPTKDIYEVTLVNRLGITVNYLVEGRLLRRDHGHQ